MSQIQVQDWLERGIRAAKRGEQEQARNLLMAVIETDEENESAWLWLSGVVDDPEDKRICLENVLYLNPSSEPAQKGLAILKSRIKPASEDNSKQKITRVIEPISPAAAVLYPERQIQDWTWSDSTDLRQVTSIGLKGSSRFDDVWEKDFPICAYCAEEISLDDKKCPNCRRNLTNSQYRYDRPSPDLYLFVTFLLGFMLFSALALILNLILRNSVVDMFWNAVLIPVVLVLVAGLISRRFWAYSASIVVLLLTLLVMIMSLLFGPESDDIVQRVMEDGLVKTLSERPIFYILAPLEQFVFPVQIVAVLLALLYAIFRVGPDFEKVKYRLEARVDKGLGDSSQFYSRGKNFAQHGMWANAVLHFRRAVAYEPARIAYRHSLAEAYAQLGYYRRSLDVLESTYQASDNPDWQSKLQEMIDRVKPQAEQEFEASFPDGERVLNEQ